MWLQAVVSGIALGLVYAGLGAGVSLVAATGRLINLAHGEFVLVGGEHLRVGAFRAAARRGWRRRALGIRDLFTGLRGRPGARPNQLSGSVQQQLALARFGMSCPRVWLLDDPIAGLDELMTGRALGWIREAAERGAGS